MIYGVDISHHQTVQNSNSLGLDNNIDFCIMKATEGKTFVDKLVTNHTTNMWKNDRIIGYYHYARPENNSALEEATHYLNTLKLIGDSIGKDLIGNCLLALDWEGNALKENIEWAKLWLGIVEEETGVKPLFYCQASYTDNIQLIKDGGYGLWVAQYNASITKPKIGVYDYYAIWQYSSSPHDQNLFNGSKEQLRKYCKNTVSTEENVSRETFVYKGVVYEVEEEIPISISGIDSILIKGVQI